MLPTLFNIGPIVISSYGVGLVLAVIIFTYCSWRYLREFALADEVIFDTVLVTLICGFVGARIVHVATNWSVFGQYFLFPLMVWKFPGFSLWGGVIAGLLAAVGLCVLRKTPVSSVLDALSRGAAYASPILYLSIFLDGTLVGTSTNWITGMVFPTVAGKQHPVALYGLALSLPLVIFMFFAPHVKRKLEGGFYFLVGLLWLGLSQLLLAFVRADLLYFKGISLIQVIATILLVAPLLPLFKMMNGPKFVGDRIKSIKAKLP